MSYEVLARKWRPKNFEELVGQEQTATALINSLTSGRLHHAYLFTGTRGVGKTTIARIFSKSINCEQGITATPCGECTTCVSIEQGNFVDLLEIDAASRTKVEDTRELLDNVQYRPTRGRYKVYLIDEVHMLSGHSFNALLKTLEEPPPHVIFLLATTDPQKLPVTVLSRCLQFSLRRMDEKEIVDHLAKVLNAESITYQPEALELIARSADGSMRDALSLLDQAIVYSGEELALAIVEQMLGAIDESWLHQLLEKVADGDATAALAVIEQAAQYSPDYASMIDDWLRLLHQIAIYQATGESEKTSVTELGNKLSAEDIQLFYQLSLQARRDLAWCPQPRQGLEMLILRCIAFRPLKPLPAQKQDSTEIRKPEKGHQPGATEAASDSPTSTDVELKKKPSDLVASEKASQPKGSQRSEVSKIEPAPTLHTDQPEAIASPQASANPVESGSDIEPAEGSISVSENQTKQTLEDRLLNSLEKNASLQSNRGSANPITANPVVATQRSDFVEGGVTEARSSQSIAETRSSSVPLDKTCLLAVNEPPPAFSEICFNNWYRVIAALAVKGQAEQILLNSLGQVVEGNLQITIDQKLAVLMSDNVQNGISQALRALYAEERFQVQLTPGPLTEETPRQRAARVWEEKLDDIEASLKQDEQIQMLIETLGCKIDRSSIQIMTNEKSVASE